MSTLTLSVPNNVSALSLFGGKVRYLGKLQNGDDLTKIETGYVYRNGKPVFPVHIHVGDAHDYLLVFPPNMNEKRVLQFANRVFSHYETFSTPRWETALEKLKTVEYAVFGHMKYEAMNGGVSYTSATEEEEQLPENDPRKVMGRKFRLAERSLIKMHRWKRTAEYLLLNVVAKPKLPHTELVDDQIVAIAAGPLTFVFQAEYRPREEGETWKLIGRTRNFKFQSI